LGVFHSTRKEEGKSGSWKKNRKKRREIAQVLRRKIVYAWRREGKKKRDKRGTGGVKGETKG